MATRDEFHFFLALVNGLCQLERRDEEVLRVALEQLEIRRKRLRAQAPLQQAGTARCGHDSRRE